MKNSRNSKSSATTAGFISLAEATRFPLPAGLDQLLQALPGRWQIHASALQVRIYPYRTSLCRLSFRHGRWKLGLHPGLLEIPGRLLDGLVDDLFRRSKGLPANPSLRRELHQLLAQIKWPEREEIPARLRRPLQAAGRTVNLQHLFDELNSTFFNNAVVINGIGWMLRPSRRRNALFRENTRVIEVCPRFDQPGVPGSTVRFLVYHEMLHALLGAEMQGSRKVFHHRRFRQLEQDYPGYDEAQRLLAQLNRPPRRRLLRLRKKPR